MACAQLKICLLYTSSRESCRQTISNFQKHYVIIIVFYLSYLIVCEGRISILGNVISNDVTYRLLTGIVVFQDIGNISREFDISFPGYVVLFFFRLTLIIISTVITNYSCVIILNMNIHAHTYQQFRRLSFPVTLIRSWTL